MPNVWSHLMEAAATIVLILPAPAAERVSASKQLPTASDARTAPPESSVQNSVSGPILGYVFDPAAQSVRPLLGIPGAATVGEPLSLGVTILAAEVSPGQDYLLAQTAENRDVTLIKLSNPPSVAQIAEAGPGVERVAFSPGGGSAALYYPATGVVLIISRLPNNPAVARTLDLAALRGRLTALAVSDDGSTVLAGIAEDNTGYVYLFSGDNGGRLIFSPGTASAITFFRNNHDVVVADGRNNEVHLIRDVAGAQAIIRLAGERDGIAGPVAVQTSDDGRQVFVANAGSDTVEVLDLAGGSAAVISCSCQPTGLHRLNGGSVFRLTELTGKPMWVLDGDWPQGRIVVIPPNTSSRPALPTRERSGTLGRGER